MLIDAIRAEWSKLRTSRYLWWISGITLLASVGVSWVMGFGAANSFNSMVGQLSADPAFAEGSGADPAQAVAQMMNLNTEALAGGFLEFGIYLVAVIAIITVTGEFASGLIGSTALVVPKRATIVAAKTIVVGVWSVLLALVSTILAVTVGWALLPAALSDQISVFGPDAGWVYFVAAVTAVLMVLVGTGLGFLLRSTAGAVVLLIFWRVIVEPLTPFLPQIGDALAPWRPFTALSTFISGDMPPYGGAPPWESPWLSLLYAAAWAVVLLLAGLFTFRSRDIASTR